MIAKKLKQLMEYKQEEKNREENTDMRSILQELHKLTAIISEINELKTDLSVVKRKLCTLTFLVNGETLNKP